jgi:hypothetical protein
MYELAASEATHTACDRGQSICVKRGGDRCRCKTRQLARASYPASIAIKLSCQEWRRRSSPTFVSCDECSRELVIDEGSNTTDTVRGGVAGCDVERVRVDGSSCNSSHECQGDSSQHHYTRRHHCADLKWPSHQCALHLLRRFCLFARME